LMVWSDNKPERCCRYCARVVLLPTTLVTEESVKAFERAVTHIVRNQYDRLVDGPAARRELEKQNPGLVAARDQAIVELRREKLQKETAEKPRKVARVRR